MGQGFKELRVWKDSKDLAVDVYKMVQHSPILSKDWGLRDQVQRSAVSVPSNIAEGDARKSDKDSVRFFHIALGSLAELRTQLEIAKELDMISLSQANEFDMRADQLASGIGALIKCRKIH